MRNFYSSGNWASRPNLRTLPTNIGGKPIGSLRPQLWFLIALFLVQFAPQAAKAQTYCNPSYYYPNDACYYYGMTIESFSIAGGGGGSSLSDIGTSCNGSGYQDRTSLAPITMYPGASYTATVIRGSGSYSSYNINVQVWIDFNNDGSFTSDESIGGYNNINPSASFSLSIPSGASIGSRRMRVRAVYHYMSYPSMDACSTTYYGEGHDYMVNIGTPCGITASTSTTPTTCYGGNDGTATVTASGYGTMLYSWAPSGGTAATATGLTAGTYTVTLTDDSCTTTKTATVSQPSAPYISGSTYFAYASTTTLTGSISGGTWSSANTGVATVNASTGVVTGASPGTATISYAVTSGSCSYTVTTNVTVTPISYCSPSVYSAYYDCYYYGYGYYITNVLLTGFAGSSISDASGCGGSGYDDRRSAVSPVTLRAGDVYALSVYTGNNTNKQAWLDFNNDGTFAASETIGGTNSSSGTVSFNIILPETVSAGSHTMRIRSIQNSGTAYPSLTACESSDYGESQDYNVNIVAACITTTMTPTNVTCYGGSDGAATVVASGHGTLSYSWAPSGGTAATATGLTAGNYTVTITDDSCSIARYVTLTQPDGAITGLSTVATGAAITLSDPISGGVWSSSNTSVATVSSTGAVIGINAGTATISYSVTGACTFVATKVVTVTPLTACVPNVYSGSSSCYSNYTINSFSFTGAASTALTDINSGCDPSCYQDRRLVIAPASVRQGDFYSASITVDSGSVTSSGKSNVQAWIDFNNDGVYATSEAVGGANNVAGAVSFTLAIPTGATLGNHNMRLRSNKESYSGLYPNMDPCSSYYFGEAQDYIITVLPSCITASVATTNNTCYAGSTGSATVTATGHGSISYSWAPSGGTAATASGLAAGTYTVTITDDSCTVIRLATITQPTVAITGSTSIAYASTTALTGPVSGGTWSSANTGIATVNASTGVVSAVAIGTATISYTVSGTCNYTITTIVTVNAPVYCTPYAYNAWYDCYYGYNHYINDFSFTGTAGTTLSDLGSGCTTSGYSDRRGSVASVTVRAGDSYTATIYTGSWTNKQAWIDFNDDGTFSSSETIGGATNYYGTVTFSLSIPGSAMAGSHVMRVRANADYETTYPSMDPCNNYYYGEAQDYNVNVLPACITATVTSTNVACYGGSTGAATVTASGHGTINYSWAPSGGTAASATGLTAGTYTVTLTDDSCTTTRMVTITQPSVASIEGYTSVMVGANTYYSHPVSGGTWSSSNTSIATVDGSTGVVTGVSVGSAIITYSITGSCTYALTANITVTPLTYCTPSVYYGWDDCYYGYNYYINNFSFTGVGSSTLSDLGSGCNGSGYQDRRSSVAAVNVRPGDTYTASIYTGNTTNKQAWIDFNNDGTFSSSEIVGGANSTSGTATFSITIPSSVAAGSRTLRVRSTRYYDVTYPSLDPCSTYYYGEAQDYNVNIVPACITATVTPTNVTCFGGSDGAAAVAATGSGTITYSWAPTGGTAATATGLTAGTYTVTLTNDSCSITKTVTITQPSVPSITGSTYIAYAGTTTLSYAISGGTWSSSNTSVATVNASTGVVAAVAPGTAMISYSVTDTSCSYTVSTIVTVNPLSYCTPYTSSGYWDCYYGYGYYISNFYSTAAGGTSLSDLSSGCTTSGYQDRRGIIATASMRAGDTYTATIYTSSTSNKQAWIDFNNDGVFSSSETIGGTNYSYSAVNFDLVIPAGATPGSHVMRVRTNGDWEATYPSMDPCTTYSYGEAQDYNINILPACITATLTSTNVTCHAGSDGAATVTASGHGTITYSWAPSGGTAATATGLSAGVYTVTLTDDSCTSARIVTITQPGPPAISGSTYVNVSGTTTLTANVSGGTWSSGHPATATIDASTGVVTGVATGTTCTISYTVTGACAVTLTTNITVNPVSYCSPYAYYYYYDCSYGYGYYINDFSFTGASGSSFSDIGTGCSSGYQDRRSVVSTVNVRAGDTYSTTLYTGGYTAKQVWIDFNSDGSFSSDEVVGGANGGSGSATFNITIPTTVPSGIRTMRIRTNNNTTTYPSMDACSGYPYGEAHDYYVNVLPACITSTVTATNVTCYGGSNGTATVTASGHGTVTYSWAPSGGTAATATGLSAGTYTVMLTDDSCTTSRMVTITQPSVASISGATTVAYAGTTTLSYPVSGGTWSSANTSIATVNASTGVVSAVSVGTATISYSVTESSCTYTVSTIVTVNAPVYCTPHAYNGWSDCYYGYQYYINNFSFTGAGGSSLSDIGSGCTSSGYQDRRSYVAMATVRAGDTYTATIYTGTWTNKQAWIDFNDDGTFSSSEIIGGTNNSYSTVTFSLSIPGGATPGNHVMRVRTNSSGETNYPSMDPCNSYSWGEAQDYDVNVLPACITTTVTATNVSCYGGSNGAATVTASGHGTVNYSWAPSGGTAATATGLSAGTYTVTLTDDSCTTTRMITITQPSVASISGSTPIAYAGTITLSYAVSGGTWSSSNTSIATVNASTGVVAAVAPGTAMISYSVTDSSCTYTVSTMVTVNPLTYCTPYTYNGYYDCYYGYGYYISNFSSTAASGTTLSDIGSGCTSSGYQDRRGLIATASMRAGDIYTATIYTSNTSNKQAWIDYNDDGVFSSSETIGGTNYSSGTVTFNLAIPAGATPGAHVMRVRTNGYYESSYPYVDPCATYSYGEAQDYDVNILPACITATLTSTNVACYGGSDGVATVTASGHGTITYSWAPSGGTAATATGLTAGTYSVTLTDDSCTIVRTVTITEPSAPAISGYSSVTMGSTSTLTSTVSGGTWSSSNTGIATIDASTGIVTGVFPGSAVITYTAAGACATTLTYPITVSSMYYCTPYYYDAYYSCYTYNYFINNFSFDGAGTSTLSDLGSGCDGSGYQDRKALIAPVDVMQGSNYTANIHVGNASHVQAWIDFNNDGYFNITETVGGIYYAIGTTFFTLSIPSGASLGYHAMRVRTNSSSEAAYPFMDACAGYSYGEGQDYFVNVVAPPTNIEGSATTCAGSSTTLTFAIAGGSWVSGNTSVATVGASSGIVTGVAAGTATISYTVSGGTYTKDVTVNTTPTPATMSDVTVCAGSTTTLSNTVSGGTWSSTDPSVATIGSTGIVSAVATGTTTVSYTITDACGSSAATAIVTVITTPTVAAITGASSVCEGGTAALSDSTSGGTWSSSDTSVVTVSASGVVTGISGGSATISYTVSNSCGSVSTTAAIAVNPLPSAGAISGELFACTGTTISLSNSVSGGSWSSSNPSVATIGSTGVVSAATVSTTTISYTVTNSCGSTSATAIVTVSTTPSAGTITGVSAVTAGATITLSNTVTGGAWNASNSNASVSSAGVVTGLAAGTVTISYTVTNSCGSTTATKVLTVNVAIEGETTVCVGGSISLSSSSTGGTWSSSNAARASVSTAGVVTGISAGTVNITYTLGTGVSVTPITVNPIPAAITGTLSVCSGSTTALANTSSGGVWSSMATSVATVGSTGIVSGLTAGTAVISYTLPTGCAASSIVTVNTSPATITGTFNVCVGKTVSLSNAVPGGTWSSSAPTKANIAATGVVTGMAAGTAYITYTMPGSCKAYAMVTVSANPAAIGGATSTMCAGLTITLTEATTGGTWSSSNSNATVVAVGTTGVVTGVAAGTAAISYTSGAGCSVAKVVTVKPNPAAITGTMSLCAGATTALASATGGGVSWVTSNATVATVNTSSGLVTGVAAGTAGITYTIGNGCKTATVVTVNQTPSAITGNAGICAGNSITLANTVSGGSWISGNTTVASIGSSTGIVSGLVSGTSVVTYALSTGCSKTIVVTVNAVPASIGGTAATCIGSTTTLTNTTTGGTWSSSTTAVGTIGVTSGILRGISNGNTTITYKLSTGCYSTTIATVNTLTTAITGTLTVCPGSTTSLANTTTGGTWSSASPTVATVGSSSGVVTGVNPGTATITYTAGCRATAVVTVNALPATITGAMSACEGSSTTLSSATSGGSWSSSDGSVATIGSSTGVVTGVAAGTATIYYALGTGCARSAVVTITPLPSSIAGASNVCVGSSITLTNTVSGNWSSSNTTVATIGSTNGIVSGLTSGTTTISFATAGTGCMATTVITVDGVPSAITGTASLCFGGTTSLSNATSGGAWSSSNTSVATVDGTTGEVTGAGAGTATIAYTLGTGCSASVVVTVSSLPAITGTTVVCEGSTTNLTNTTTGGVWTSGATGIATVNATTGVVTGVAGGVADITYTLSSGCATSTTVLVNPKPDAITGTLAACLGASNTLTSATTGGVWSSTLPSIVSIDSFTGVAYSGSAGAATIKYTLTTGCAATAIATVNPMPGTISGTMSTCVGSSVILTNTTSGGVWSSADTTVSVDAPTGEVTGVSAGTAVISYTLSTGCARTAIVTVNTAASAITGTSNLCVGASATFTNATTGGTWSSSAPSIANVITATGVVTAMSAGNATITYSVAGGCSTTFSLTVDAAPATITGTKSVCPGTTTTLASTTSGGTWSSGSTSIATVGSATGIVNGLVTGTAVITYTAAGGCYATTVVTVTAAPSPITGAMVVCSGTTTTLNSATTGGVSWTSSNPAVATINTSTRVVTGVSLGTTTITYMIGSGCYVIAVVTVTAPPSSITGATSVCAGASTTFTDSVSGGTWSSSNTTYATVNPTTGVVTGVTGGSSSVITYSVGSGCYKVKSIYVNASPAASGGYATACVGLTTTFTNAAGGVWSSSDASIATVVASGTNPAVTGVAPGTANISFTLAGCSTVKVVTVIASPGTITGTNNVCVSLQTTLANSVAGGVWSSSNTGYATIGSATGIVTGAAIPGTVTISYSFGANCRATLPVYVRQIPSTITGIMTICAGTATTLASSPVAGTWSSSNMAVGTIASVSTSQGRLAGLTPGTTTITYTAAPSCSRTAVVTVNSCSRAAGSSTTGIDGNVGEVIAVTAYPNPTSGTFTVEAHGAGTFHIYTLEGKELAKYDVMQGKTTITLAREIAAGIYMCRYSGSDGSTVMVRLVYEP